jgi:hypothetical protein
MNRALYASLLVAAAGAATSAQQPAGAPAPGQPRSLIVKDHKEGGPVMAPAPPRAPVYSRAFGDDARTVVLLRQVNVSPQGMNIVGDAANEPSIVIDPTAPNRIAIGWRQFNSISSNFRQGGRAYSVDGGRTWTNPGVLTPGQFRSDPVLRSSPDGLECYVNIGDPSTFSIDAFSSTSGGQTWSGPTPARAGDKQWIAIDQTTLPSRGFIYESWQTCCGADRLTTFTRSTNGGATWMQPVAMPGPPIFGTMIVGRSGQVFTAGLLSGSSSSYLVTKSTDAGNAAATPTFTSSSVNLGGSFTVPGGVGDPNPAGLEGQVWIDTDRSTGPRGGWVYVVATVYRGGVSPQDVVFVRSTDGGATWSPPVNVNNDPPTPAGWHWFGTLGVAPSGRIDVVWNDTRESQNVNTARLYYAWSTDGGSTWQGNIPLTTPYNTALGYPQQNKLGDYYDIVSDDVGASIAFAATFNGEQDVYFLRVNDFDCNRNGIGDSADLASGVLHDCNGNGVPDECERAAGVAVNCPCYANCDGSTASPVLNVADFTCFLQRYASGDAYANCDGSTAPPVHNVADFTCFLQKYAVGCP